MTTAVMSKAPKTHGAEDEVVEEGRVLEQVYEIDPFRIRPCPTQPRKIFKKIPELAEGIQEIGQTTPVIVKKVNDDPDHEYELVDGERRLKACQLIRRLIRAIVRTGPMSQAEQFAQSVAANFCREDHTVVEIAKACDVFVRQGKTQLQISKIFGKSVGWVGQHLSLLRLDPAVLAMLDPENNEDEESGESKSKLTFSIALLIVTLPYDMQLPAANKIVKDEMSMTAARRYILKVAQKSGVQAGRRPRTQSELFDVLERMINHLRDRVGVYIDMRASELRTILTCRDPDTRRRLAENIRTFMEELGGLAKELEKSGPMSVGN